MRIVLVDHELYRLGLRLVLEASPDCEVVGEAGGAHEAFKVVRAVTPDVVVIDTVLRDLRSPSAIKKIRRCARGARVLVFTESGTTRAVAAALAAGARGYALKDDSNEEICRAVRQVHQGWLYLAPTLYFGSVRTSYIEADVAIQ